MQDQRIFQRLERFVPSNAVHYCYDLWAEHPFQFIVATNRATKLGDYRFNPADKSHVITVNRGINPYSFLVTYIHEVAHMTANLRYGPNIKPHGDEWKSEFQRVMLPILNDLVFPDKILKPLRGYMRNPKASSQSDPYLAKALKSFDPQDDTTIYLHQLGEGTVFTFQSRVFKKEKKQRTRSLCLEIGTGKRYLIPEIAPVFPMPSA